MKKSIGIILALAAVLAVLLALAAVLGLAFKGVFTPAAESTAPAETQTAQTQQTGGSTTLPVIDPDGIEWDNTVDFGDDDGLINILFIGQDRRQGEGRQRSDSMILCSLNPETNELAMISFMRDLYVQIPGYQDNRLNAAYAYGGFELLTSALKTNFDVSVDGCVEVDFEGFCSIVDTIGGIDIELSEKEAEIVGGNAEKGVCRLDGSQTLTYARIRKIDSDFIRTQRQRNVLKAIFDKVKALDTAERLAFAAALFPMVTTDVEQETLMALAMQYASSLDEMQISTARIPADGAYTHATVREMAVLIPDLEENKRLIFEEYLPLD